MDCDYCEKPKAKPYIIADNLEEPRYLCDKCKEELDWEVLQKLSNYYENNI